VCAGRFWEKLEDGVQVVLIRGFDYFTYAVDMSTLDSVYKMLQLDRPAAIEEFQVYSTIASSDRYSMLCTADSCQAYGTDQGVSRVRVMGFWTRDGNYPGVSGEKYVMSTYGEEVWIRRCVRMNVS
jgi:hypothetical protein